MTNSLLTAPAPGLLDVTERTAAIPAPRVAPDGAHAMPTVRESLSARQRAFILRSE